jgi:HK97 gp10 family phage protein
VITGEVTITSDRLPAIAAALPREAQAVTGKMTMDLEGEIKQTIDAVGAVDTGHMMNTVQGHPEDGTVTTGAPYWELVDKGTAKMPARPFVDPSVDALRPALEAAVRQMLGRL